MIGPIKPFNSIGEEEMVAAAGAVVTRPLSGYLAGQERGGFSVRALEDAWCETFGVKHAIACNSATSALLAACVAVGVMPGDDVVTTPYTMSATSAAPAFLGANLIFGDVDDETFGLKPSLDILTPKTKAVVITNLFGHPSHLSWWRRAADTHGFFLIEDNAQSPLAIEHGRFSGTIGHVGAYSLNIHKHFQSGEGGICVTDDDDLCHRIRMFINHAECFDDKP